MSDLNYIEEISQVWDMVKESFKDKNGEALSETTVNLWFDDITVISYETRDSDNSTDILTLGIRSDFKHRIVSEKYLDKIKNAFTRFLGFEIDINLIKTGSATDANTISTPIPAPKQEESPIEMAIEGRSVMPIYNFEYTFEKPRSSSPPFCNIAYSRYIARYESFPDASFIQSSIRERVCESASFAPR